MTLCIFQKMLATVHHIIMICSAILFQPKAAGLTFKIWQQDWSKGGGCMDL